LNSWGGLKNFGSNNRTGHLDSPGSRNIRARLDLLGQDVAMRDGCGKLDMEMSREPVAGAKTVHDLASGLVSEFPVLRVLLKVLLFAEKEFEVTKNLDPVRPVVGQTDVDLSANLEKLANIEFADMEDGVEVFRAIWNSLMVGLAVVVPFPDARHAGDTERAIANDIRSTEIVDVVSDPTTVVELKQVVACLVVATTEDGQERCQTLTTVVLVVVSHFAKFGGNGETRRIVGISEGLSELAEIPLPVK
jgi:hypothetical protein